MTGTVIDIRDRMDRAGDRSRRTIRRLRDYRGLRKDDQLAAAVGMGRTKVNNYVTGKTKLSIEMVAAFAAALNVPDYVLAMEPDDAERWVMDNSPNGPDGPGGVTDGTSDVHVQPTYREVGKLVQFPDRRTHLMPAVAAAA